MLTCSSPDENIVIRNGVVVDPSENLNQPLDVLIEKGKIAAVDKTGSFDSKLKNKNCIEFDARDCKVCPGFIDLKTNVDEPSDSPYETFASVSRAAAKGGFTSIVCMPNCKPIRDSAIVTELTNRLIKDKSIVRVFPVGAVTKEMQGKRLAEIGLMAESGIYAVSDSDQTIDNSYVMKKALEYVQAFNMPIFTFPEDANLVGKGVMQEGTNSAKLGLRGIPAASEEIIIARDLVLLRHLGGHIHFSPITTLGSIKMIQQAKHDGLLVSADTNPHYLVLNSRSIESYDANFKARPPLRGKSDQRELIKAVADGTIDCIATNHLACSYSAKDMVFEFAQPGISCLETAFSTMVQVMKNQGFEFSKLVELLANNPARVLNQPEIGRLRKGNLADVTIVDLEKTVEVSPEFFLSKGKNSPFLGKKIRGLVVGTIVNGKIVYGKEI